MTLGSFWERGYALAENLLSPDQIAFVRSAMDTSLRTGAMHRSQGGTVPEAALNQYAPLGGEAMLVQSRAEIEALVGRELVPAYAFWRIYERGAALLRHVDRNACEVSATITVASDPANADWPIMVEGLDGTSAALVLRPGDAAIYLGCQVPHWRDPLPGASQHQLFLHYVVKDGPNAARAFDGRGKLRLGIAPEG